MAYLFLIIAIIFEVAGALSLRMATSGSKKKGLWLLAVLGGRHPEAIVNPEVLSK